MLHGCQPSLMQGIDLFCRHLWTYRLFGLTHGCHLVKVGPLLAGESVHHDGSQRRGLFEIGYRHGRLQHIGLELHKKTVTGRPTIDTQLLQLNTCRTGHHIDQVLDLISDRF